MDNTGVETEVYSLVVPANTLQATGRLSITLFGNVIGLGGSDEATLRAKIGGTTITSRVNSVNSGTRGFVIEANWVSEGATSSTIWMRSQGWVDTTNPFALDRGASTADLTTELTFSVTWDWTTAGAGRTYTMEYADAVLYFPVG